MDKDLDLDQQLEKKENDKYQKAFVQGFRIIILIDLTFRA